LRYGVAVSTREVAMPRRSIVLVSIAVLLSCTTRELAGPPENRGPTARITLPSAPVLEGSAVTFDATLSTDPDGDSLTYVWVVGDGISVTGPLAVHTFPDDGAYNVTLIARDRHGVSDTATAQVSVENAAPVLGNFAIPDSIGVGMPMTIRVWARDPGSTDVLTMQIDWKDGSDSIVDYNTGLQGFTATHRYSTTGEYVVGLTIRDNDGGITQQALSRGIVVTPPSGNRPPIARLSAPNTAAEGHWVSFSAAGSTDPDGDHLTATWLSGDRSWALPCAPGPVSDCERSFLFPDDGIYRISVIVADSSGAADTASHVLTILNSVPDIAWSSIPSQQAIDDSARVQVRVADFGTDPLTIAVDWGDGTAPTVAPADTSVWDWTDRRYVLGGNFTHAYATTGTYAISATARDDDGGADRVAPSQVVIFNPNERRTLAGYEAVDLGTLGGSSARPFDFNDYGQVVGRSKTASGAQHAFLWDESGMHDLGTMGHDGSEALRINNSGLIAGTVWRLIYGSEDDNKFTISSPTIWQSAAPTALVRSPAVFYGRFYLPSGFWQLFEQPPIMVPAINGSGEVAWVSYGEYDANGWLWRDGWHSLRLTGWDGSLPTAMNDRGQVVGAVHREDSPYLRAFLWEDGSSRDLGVLASWTCASPWNVAECSTAAAMDINASGQIVGISTDQTGRYHFVLWDNLGISDLGSTDRFHPQALPRVFINDRGDIAGSASGQAFFWSGGVKTSLPSIGGSLEVVGLSENGEVFGNILRESSQHAFVWSQARGMLDLGTGAHGFSAAWVVDINGRGDVLGYTAPCILDAENHCRDFPIDFGRNPLLTRSDVRAILWRKK
jgi:probable HAF family extracellular repeat protein